MLAVNYVQAIDCEHEAVKRYVVYWNSHQTNKKNL